MRLVAQASLLIIAYFTLAGCIKTPGHEGVSVEIIDPKTGSLTFAGESCCGPVISDTPLSGNSQFRRLKFVGAQIAQIRM
jgi:hypothetical protein